MKSGVQDNSFEGPFHIVIIISYRLISYNPESRTFTYSIIGRRLIYIIRYMIPMGWTTLCLLGGAEQKEHTFKLNDSHIVATRQPIAV